MTPSQTSLVVIISVLSCSALFGWMVWRSVKASDNPRVVRNRFYRGAGIYAFGALMGIEQVATGQAPIWALLFLPIPIGFIWIYLRAAKRIPADRSPMPEASLTRKLAFMILGMGAFVGLLAVGMVYALAHGTISPRLLGILMLLAMVAMSVVFYRFLISLRQDRTRE
jgi:hypothetical protein